MEKRHCSLCALYLTIKHSSSFFKYHLVTSDYYSNFFELNQLPNSCSETIILKHKSHFARYGCPEQVISDNGLQFISEKFAEFAREWDFTHRTSSPGNSKANGKAESVVKIAKRLLRKAVDTGPIPGNNRFQKHSNSKNGVKSGTKVA